MLKIAERILLVSVFIISAMSIVAQTKTKDKSSLLSDTAKKNATPTLAEKVKSSKKVEGLLTLYQDTATGSVQIYIRKNQLGKEFIYQSIALGGPNMFYLNSNLIRATWIFKIQKTFDKLEFVEQNTNFYYDSTNAVSKAANVDVPDAVFYSDKIAADDSAGYLIAGDGLFLSEKLDPIKPIIPPSVPPTAIFNLGNLNLAKSKYERISSFTNNTDVIVDLAFDNPVPFNQGENDITDARYNRIRFQHSFLEEPHDDFKPRRDDPRVGYFSEEIDNLTTIEAPNYRDLICRWNLKKKDPTASISEPVNPIVWWVENKTPVEYRQTILEAGLRWNEAFEKAGFKNAVVMKIMPDTATWDPADIRYNVIRWVSSPHPTYGAIGMSCVDPKTGEIFGADINIEWFSGSATPIFDELYNSFGSENAAHTSIAPFAGSQKSHMMTCTMAQELKAQYMAGLTDLEIAGAPPEEIREMHKQFLYYLVLHEMGHTLGLNHNMKASQMLSPEEVNNKEITDKIGMQGSVMDYPAINIALNHSKQGDYYTSRPGPYDLWAIEFGYTECTASLEEATLNKILSRSTDPHLAFGNDADDMRSPGGGGVDPRVMINDMSNDVVAYASDRFKLVNMLMGKMITKYSKPGRSYQELRSRYGTLNSQRYWMAASVSRYIGGLYVDRSYVGQNSRNKPFVPTPADYQKKAVELLSKYVFAPNAYDADAQLFPYLQLQRRGFEFFGITEDPKPQVTILAMQMGVIAHVFSAHTLARINTTSLYGNTYSVADVMNDFTKAIFDADKATSVNLYRQNIQTEFVKTLINIANPSSTNEFDDPSRAIARSTLKKIKTLLATAVSPNEQTKSHRDNLNFMIDKALVVK